MNSLLLSIVGCLVGLSGRATAVCTNVSYTPSGEVDITATLYACSASIGDPLLVPSYSKDVGNITITSQLAVNNLLSIDEINGAVQMDLFFRLTWHDPQWHLPNMFLEADPAIKFTGVELKDLVHFDDDPLKVWLPNDFTYTNLLSLSQNAETLKLAPGGFFFWSRHQLLELSQSSFDYHDYPLDKQQIVISFESYGLPANYLQLAIADPAITYIKNGNKDINFQQNPIWKHNLNDYTSSVNTADYEQYFDGQKIIRTFQNIEIKMAISRESNGILVRLAFPVLLLILIGAITFWSFQESRIDTTMTLLLAVSALYIVVFSTVPLLGYLTSFDRYFIELFILLTSCLAVHQVVSNLNAKREKWPLRRLVSRSMEFLGRLMVMPIAGFLYLYEFGVDNFSPGLVIAFFVFISFYAVVLSIRELPALRSTCKKVMKTIHLKLDAAEQRDISWIELLIFNFFRYQVISTSIRYHFKLKDRTNSDELKRDEGNLKVKRFKDNDSDDEDDGEDVEANSRHRDSDDRFSEDRYASESAYGPGVQLRPVVRNPVNKSNAV